MIILKVNYIPAHEVAISNLVINPAIRNRIKVFENSVAGPNMVIAGINEGGKIETFCPNKDKVIEVIIN